MGEHFKTRFFLQLAPINLPLVFFYLTGNCDTSWYVWCEGNHLHFVEEWVNDELFITVILVVLSKFVSGHCEDWLVDHHGWMMDNETSYLVNPFYEQFVTYFLVHCWLTELRGLDLQTGSFTLRQIKAATNNFNVSNKIGEGGFGSVFKVFCIRTFVLNHRAD